MKYILILLSCCLLTSAFSQQLKKGVILPDASGQFSSGSVYFPTIGLNVFNSYGERIGQIERGSDSTEAESYKLYFKKDGKRNKIENPNYYMVGYEVMALVFTDIVAGFVQIDDNYWLEIETLASHGLELVNWMEYATKKEKEWYANEPGLNLRTAPSINGNILATLKGNLFEIKSTQETNGLWCKVEVTEYRVHPCSGESNIVIRTVSGWAKLISDEQTLNVWYNAKGC